MKSNKFLTESARISEAYFSIKSNVNEDLTSQTGKIASRIFNGKKTDATVKPKQQLQPRNGSSDTNSVPSTISSNSVSTVSHDITQNKIPEPPPVEIEYPENGDIEYTGDEEDYLEGKTDIRPKTLAPNAREEYRKTLPLQNVGESDEGQTSEINKLSEICADFGASIKNVYDGHDDCIIVLIRIEDPDRKPGVGFNMNYIMGVGQAIEDEMKKSGLRGFVGAGGYMGNVTKVHLLKNNIEKTNESENKDYFYEMVKPTLNYLSDYIEKIDFDGDKLEVKFNRFKKGWEDGFQMLANVMGDASNKSSAYGGDSWEFGHEYRNYGELCYIKKGGQYHDGGLSTPDDGDGVNPPELGESYDEHSYNYYVIVQYGKNAKIESGWEFKEDAIDRAKELKNDFPKSRGKIKVVSVKGLRSYSIYNPSDDSDWVDGNISDYLGESKELDEESNDEIERSFKNFLGGREPCIETAEGVVYFQYNKTTNKFEYGTATNTGLLKDGEFEYDKYKSMQSNLEELVSEIEEKYGVLES